MEVDIVCGAKEMKDANGFQTVSYTGLTAQRLKEVKETVINNCTNAARVNPPINPIVDEIEVPNDPTRRVLIFTIDATPYAHTYKCDRDDIPRYFIRTDYSTKEATNGFIRELLRRKGNLEPWDKRMNPKASINDIDELVLRQYLQLMKLWSDNKSITDYLSDKEKIEEFIPPLLAKVGVDKPLHPKNFTLLTFGKSPIDFCVGAYSIFTIFEGNDKSKQHAETQWLRGTVVEQANKLIELLNIESTIAIDKGSDNANQIKYPQIALKEAIVNAVVHRDYEIDQPIRVEVYNDRIEIYSPGGLPFNLDKTKFQQGKAKASWRNQSFGRIFHKLNLAQHQGSGIEKIIAAMQEEGSPMPTFQVDDDSVTCILPAHPRHVAMKELSEAESDIVIRDYESAYTKLIGILNKDIYNYRALELFCHVNNLSNTPIKVLELIVSKNIDFQQIRPNTLLVIAESLSLLSHNKEAEILSKKLLDIAINSQLAEQQLAKVAHTLKKLGYDKDVVNFVNRAIQQNPTLANNALLLNSKGRALIDLAKICQTTFKENNNPKIKQKAKIDFERYIVEAQRTLSSAYENSDSSIDKDFITRSLSYIKTDMMPFLNESNTNPEAQAKTLCITNIPTTASDKEISAIYEKYGEVLKVSLSKARNNKQYAFIEFAKPSEAQAAFSDRFNIFLNGHKIYTQYYKNNSK